MIGYEAIKLRRHSNCLPLLIAFVVVTSSAVTVVISRSVYMQFFKCLHGGDKKFLYSLKHFLKIFDLMHRLWAV